MSSTHSTGWGRPGGCMLQRIRAWICPYSDAPDFKQIVDKVLAVFAVFTGATFTFFVNDFFLMRRLPAGFADFDLWERIYVLAGVIALLLRYIMGSAVHFNAAYVPKSRQTVVREVQEG